MTLPNATFAITAHAVIASIQQANICFVMQNLKHALTQKDKHGKLILRFGLNINTAERSLLCYGASG